MTLKMQTKRIIQKCLFAIAPFVIFVFAFFSFFIKLSTLTTWITVCKWKKLYLDDVEPAGVNVETFACCAETDNNKHGRCLAGHGLDKEDEDLINDNGVSIVKLERSFYETYDHSSTHCTRNAHNFVTTLIELALENSAESTAAYFLNYQKCINRFLISEKIILEGELLRMRNAIMQQVQQCVLSLQTNIREELRLLYDNLEATLLHDTKYLKRVLHEFQYSKELSNCNTSENLFLKYQWEKLKEKKKKLETLMKEAGRLIYAIQAASIKNKYLLPFLNKNVQLRGNQTVCDILNLIVERMYHDIIMRVMSISTPYKVNTSNLQIMILDIKSTLALLDTRIKSTCCRLLKYLSSTTGGLLRGVLALFLYIWKTTETKCVQCSDQELYQGTYVNYNESVGSCWKLFCAKERFQSEIDRDRCTELIYSLFAIDLTSSRWNVLHRRLANSNNVETILDTLNQCSTLIYAKMYLLRLQNIITTLKHTVQEIIAEQNASSGEGPVDAADNVSINEQVYNQFRSSVMNTSNTLYQFLSTVRNERKLNAARQDIISRMGTLQNVLDWLCLLEELNGDEEMGKKEENVKREQEGNISARCSTESFAEAVKHEQKKQKRNSIELSEMNVMHESNVSEVNNRITPGVVYLLLYIINAFLS